VVVKMTLTAMLETSATPTPTLVSQPVLRVLNVLGSMRSAMLNMTIASSVGVTVMIHLAAVQVAMMMILTVLTPSLSVTRLPTLVVVKMTLIVILATFATPTPTLASQPVLRVLNVLGSMMFVMLNMTIASSVGVTVMIHLAAVQVAMMMISTVPTPSLSVTRLPTLVDVTKTLTVILETSATLKPTLASQPVQITLNVLGLTKSAIPCMTTASSAVVLVEIHLAVVQVAMMMVSIVNILSLSATKITLVAVKLMMTVRLPTSATLTPTLVNLFPMSAQSMLTAMRALLEFVRLVLQSRLSVTIAHLRGTEMSASQDASMTLAPVTSLVVLLQALCAIQKPTSVKQTLALYCSQRWCSHQRAVMAAPRKV